MRPRGAVLFTRCGLTGQCCASRDLAFLKHKWLVNWAKCMTSVLFCLKKDPFGQRRGVVWDPNLAGREHRCRNPSAATVYWRFVEPSLPVALPMLCSAGGTRTRTIRRQDVTAGVRLTLGATRHHAAYGSGSAMFHQASTALPRPNRAAPLA